MGITNTDTDRVVRLAHQLMRDLGYAAPEIRSEKVLWALLQAYSMGFESGSASVGVLQ